MAKNAAELDTGRLEKIELQQLDLSPFNVRKNCEVGPEDELVASIRAHGLLQPLVGHIAKSGPAMVLICAGQRRLLALRHITKSETKIPVRIVEEETAIEVSLAENLERKNMNPADEFAAFKALIDTGHYDADRIASRFGFNLALVKRRLKMATLIPEILVAVREGAITIEAAEAYAAGSAEVQKDVFKKHNAKGAWEPHKPERVRGDIVIHGLAANSRVGKFIGGMEAYRAAGGTVIDDAFLELFAKDEDEGRMRDVSIVRELLKQRQEELAPKLLDAVKAKYPFVTGFEWANLFGSYNVEMPKPAKKSGLVVVGNGWNSDAADTTKRAKKAAKDHGGVVIAIMSIDADGQPEILAGKFLIGKDAWDKVKPEERSYNSTYREPTPEERAAAERQRNIKAQAIRLAVAGIPDGKLVELVRGHGRASVWHGEGGAYDFRIDFQASQLEPFLDEAAKQIDAANAAQQTAAVGFDAKLAELEKLPVAEWPVVTVVDVDMGDDPGQLIITPIIENGCHLLNLVDAIERPSTSEDPEFTVEVIRDQTRDHTATISTYDSIEAFSAEHAGTCRICACTEPCACVDSDRDPDWHGPCAWADATQTLCSNPDCLTKAGIAIGEPEDQWEPEAVSG